MALVKHVQLAISAQQSQTYRSYVKQENIGTKQKLTTIFIKISVDIYTFYYMMYKNNFLSSGVKM